MKKKIKLGLLPLIIIAMGAGICAGMIFPDWLSRVFITFNGIFSGFLDFIIPLLIIGFVAPAISDIGRGAGRMLAFTAILAYVATISAGLFAYFCCDWAFPSLISVDRYISQGIEAQSLSPYFSIAIQPLMSVMTALILAFLLGIGTASLPSGSLRRGLSDFREIIQKTIRYIIIPLLPLFIFGIFLNMTREGQIGSMMMTFGSIILVIFVLHIVLLVGQYLIAALFSGTNPFRALWTMMPAYFTALGTQSSAATIPVTLERTERMGVDKDVAGFVIPLCATIHMSGSTLKIVACAMALMLTQGHHYDAAMFAGFIAMLAITIVAAPGVPGGAIMAAQGLLSTMLGFSASDNALMISLYIAMDAFGTACNVTGDGALAQIVNRFFGVSGTLRCRTRVLAGITMTAVALGVGSLAASAQNDTVSSPRLVEWSVSANGSGSTGEWAPYLIGSNSGGRHAMSSEATVTGSIWTDYDADKRFSWTAGAEVSAGYQSSAQYDRYDAESGEWGSRPWHPHRAIVQQLWAGVKYRGVMLWAGMRDHLSYIVDDNLSSGDLVYSNNARAIPQVEIGFLNYQNIPFTKGWVQILGSLSYGKYTDSSSLKHRFGYWTSHIALGQFFTYKHVHFRTRQDRPFAVTIGVQTGGEFGGTTYKYAYGNMFAEVKNGSDLRAFWEMIIPTKRYRDGFVEGNTVGSWDFKARYRLRTDMELEAYFQWLWEDGSGMARRNMTDGLWGVSVKLPPRVRGLKKVVAEYIDFSDQSGPIHWAPSDAPGTTVTGEASGGDNYYNNSSFNAWVNYGLSIGSSFPKAPLYNSDGYPQFKHNRTRGFQLAGTGSISDCVDWTAKFSYGVARGEGRIPYPRLLRNTSAMLAARWDASSLLRGLAVNASLAFDAGSLRGNNFGGLISVTYSGAFMPGWW